VTWRFWRREKDRPPTRPVVRLHETVLSPTLAAFRASRGANSRHEGVVYWAGRAQSQEWIVTTCIVPEAATTAGSFRTSAAGNARVVALLAAADLILLAQVHSHPGNLVDHSDGDDADALMPYENFLSVVVPQYGNTTLWPLDHCGVHRFEQGRFRRLTTREVTATFRLIPVRLDTVRRL
jgi:proteasome lid subunit RPN8/RPN11